MHRSELCFVVGIEQWFGFAPPETGGCGPYADSGFGVA